MNLEDDLRELEERHGRKYSRIERTLILDALRSLPDPEVPRVIAKVVAQAQYGLPKAKEWIALAKESQYRGTRGIPAEGWVRYDVEDDHGNVFSYVAHPSTGILSEEDLDLHFERKRIALRVKR